MTRRQVRVSDVLLAALALLATTAGLSACSNATTGYAAPPATAGFLEIRFAGEGRGKVTSSPEGIDAWKEGADAQCTHSCSHLFPGGTWVVLTAAADTGWTFGGFQGCETTGNTCRVNMSQAQTITATFHRPTLSVTLAGTGVGTVTSLPTGISCSSGTCSASFDVDTLVTLSATPAAGSTFTGWTGACTGTGACAVRMSEDRAVTATFHRPTVSLTISGAGHVTSSPAGLDCSVSCEAGFDPGTVVTLTPTAPLGSMFSGWSGACTGTGTCTLTMSADRAVTATFVPSNAVPLALLANDPAAAIPVRTGVPFHWSANALATDAFVTSLGSLCLSDGNGIVPAQYDVLSTWPDGSFKSVLVQFVTDVGPQKNYVLAYRAGTNAGCTPATGVAVTQASGTTTVNTGVIRFDVDAHGLISSLWRDTTLLLSGGEFFMVKAATPGVEFDASASTSTTVTVEEHGPVRAVVRATGSLMNGADVVMKYLVRYYAYAGSDKLDIDFTVTDDRLEANAETPGTTLALSVLRYGMRWDYTSGGATQYRYGLDASGVASGTVSGESYLFQDGAFVFETIGGSGTDRGNTFSYTGVGTGKRAPGWVALDSSARHVALMVRDFWQQYPMELNVTATRLTAELFADRGITTPDLTLPTQSGTVYKRPNTFYFLRPGGAKTHQLRLAFDDVTPTDGELTALNNGYQRHRLELVAPPAWYAQSGVFGDIDPGTSSTANVGYDAMLMRDIYVPSIEAVFPSNLEPTDLGGNATMYGWRDYGDRLRAGWNGTINGVAIPSFYNDTHIGANLFLHEFIRTLDQRWFRLGEISTRHFSDVDVVHGPRSGYWNTGNAYPGLGQQPPGEIHAITHSMDDHQCRNMHWGHAHVSGTSDLYLLTGDKHSLEVLTEIAGWWRFMTPYFFRTPFDANFYREAERDYAWPLYVMNEYVRVTGDATYHHDTAGQLVKYLIAWWQTPLAHIGWDPVGSHTVNVGMNDASSGTGWWTMKKMDNGAPSCDGTVQGRCPNGVNPWMAGPLLSAVIKFRQQDALMTAAGMGSGISPATLQDMCLQCMNYLVKYGWIDHDSPPPSNAPFFAYSEFSRTYTGGHTLIDYPLAYLDALYATTALRWAPIDHPEWYDTRAKWGPIARGYYNGFRTTTVGSNTQSYGFYGYEEVTPVDFFKIMGTNP